MKIRHNNKTQKLFDNVTQKILDNSEAQSQFQLKYSSHPYEEPIVPEVSPIGGALLGLKAGPALAKGLGGVGEKAMPSALLKNVGQVFPKLAKATTAISPYADAGVLSLGGAENLRNAKESIQNGDVAKATAETALAVSPLMGIRPNLTRELTNTEKANEVARALNREIRSAELSDTPHVYAIFKDSEMTPKLSEAERLGIPKGERSNPKALENPQYGGYQQGNQRYNDAINSGNLEEVQRLRDLHFKVKAPNTKVVDENGMPLHTYHGTMKHFTIFNNVNPKDIKFKTGGYHTADYDLANSVYGKGGYYNPANGKFFRKYGSVYDDYLNITNPFIDTPSHNISDIVGKLTRGNEYPNWGSLNGSGRVFIKNGGFDGVFVPRYHNTYLPTNSASQIKSAAPITGNGKGEIIPIVKRDNFHNPDIRYKQGGTLKAQKGKSLIRLINKTTKRPITHINDFSGVENIVKESIGFGGVHPNLGLQELETENRSKQLMQNFEEMLNRKAYEAKRDTFLKDRIGKTGNELTPNEQYGAKIRFKEYGDK